MYMTQFSKQSQKNTFSPDFCFVLIHTLRVVDSGRVAQKLQKMHCLSTRACDYGGEEVDELEHGPAGQERGFQKIVEHLLARFPRRRNTLEICRHRDTGKECHPKFTPIL